MLPVSCVSTRTQITILNEPAFPTCLTRLGCWGSVPQVLTHLQGASPDLTLGEEGKFGGFSCGLEALNTMVFFEAFSLHFAMGTLIYASVQMKPDVPPPLRD